MAPALANGNIRPISHTAVIVLIFLVLASTLLSIAIWLLFIRSHQPRLPTSATQIHVQVEVEKSRSSIPRTPTVSSRSSLLPFPEVATCPFSAPSVRLRTLWDKLQRRSSAAATAVPPPSRSTDNRYSELPPSPRGGQSPVKREMWFAFETDASLATFDNDPLAVDGSRRDQFFLPLSGDDDCGSSSLLSTPALVSGISSPVSTWEPPTPPPVNATIYARRSPTEAVAFPNCTQFVSPFGCATEPSPVDPKGPVQEDLKIRETESAGYPSPLNFAAFDAPPQGTPGTSFPSDVGTDYGVNAGEDTRYAALLNAFSTSFSASSLGLSGSDRDSNSHNDSVHFHDHGPEFSVVCVISFGDKVNGDGLGTYDDDYERDIGTVALHRSCSLAGDSFLAM